MSGLLVDPVLAFIKTYQLRGDTAGLKRAVCSSFDLSALSNGHKHLWNVCSAQLEKFYLVFHARRGSDKNPLSDVLLVDIILAFEKLDINDTYPWFIVIL